jgi:hypothetical protein
MWETQRRRKNKVCYKIKRGTDQEKETVPQRRRKK